MALSRPMASDDVSVCKGVLTCLLHSYRFAAWHASLVLFGGGCWLACREMSQGIAGV